MFKYFSILFICVLFISCGKDTKKQDYSSIQGKLNGGFPSLFVDYEKEAQIQIRNLYQGAINFYQQNGRMPGDCYQEM